MKLFTKIFLLGMLVFGLTFSAAGYFLLHYSLESSLARESEFALKQYQYDKFTVQSAMLTATSVTFSLEQSNDLIPAGFKIYTIRDSVSEELILQDKAQETGLFQNLASELSVPAAFYEEDGSLLYSGISHLDSGFLDTLTENAHTWQFCAGKDGGSILVGSALRQEDISEDKDGGQLLYFITQRDISKTLAQQNVLRQYFLRCYLVAMSAGTVLLMLLSAFLTRPLNKMSAVASRMAKGNYRERLSRKGRDEIGILAESFNRMADAVEEKIDQLAKAAREKEDFVANFAHELKTPLTSIIGYADTIYQKELSREEVRRASWYIWNEGLRLEALSLKLMELTVLGRQDFPLTELPADELLQDAAEGLAPLFTEKKIDFLLQAEHSYVLADSDLLKTLLINLADNSIKAGASRIELSGHADEDGRHYLIRVRDNGCGMEPEELSRITEAFYMVDKARSRKQHGAGLGLALADKVAGLHGDRLHFESLVGDGTTVSFSLDIPPAEPEDPDNKAADGAAAEDPAGNELATDELTAREESIE